MEQNWITYPIFISSTFRDMDQERDVIKQNVIPQLNNYYRHRHVQFQAIDLRVGINTQNLVEDQRESYVLDICMEKIEQSRPFFVALLGERYGWIPDEKRWQMVIDRLSEQERPLLNGSQGCSVTELEILYGAIGEDGKHLGHSIFMMRSALSYQGMPDEKKNDYIDEYNVQLDNHQKQEHRQRLEDLKKRINELTKNKRMDECVIPYDLKWDNEGNRFIHLQDFINLLYKRLCFEIDNELDTLPNEALTWQGQDNANAEAVASLLVKQSVPTSTVNHVIDLLEQGHRQLLITGDVGTGKSVVAAHCIEHLKRSGYTCCCGWIGLTSHAHHMRPIIIRWIQQLSGSNEWLEDELMDSHRTTDARLYEILHAATQEAEHTGGKVCFILDGVEQLKGPYDHELYQMWIHNDMMVVLTAQDAVSKTIRHHHQNMEEVRMGHLSLQDKQLIIAFEGRENNIQLPDSLHAKLLVRQFTPLQFKLVMLLFCQLSITDFQHIRNLEGASEIDKINQYLEQLYDKAPQELDQLVKYVIHELVVRMQLPESYENIFTWLAASQQGLRQSDIIALLGSDADMLQMHSLTYILQDILVTDTFSYHWKIRNQAIRQALLPQDSRPIFRQLVDLLITLEDNDPVKQDIFIYCLIESEDYSSGCDYLGTFKKYDNESDMRRWYAISSNLLLTDPDRLKHLKAVAAQMQPKQIIMLMRLMTKYGVDGFVHALEVRSWCESLLLGIQDMEALDKVAAFYLGLLLISPLHRGTPFQGGSASWDKKRFNMLACEAFKRCYTVDPDYDDVKGLYCGALMSMADIAQEEGDFEKANEYINLAMTIQ